MEDYKEFLKSKQKTHIESGFIVPDKWLNPNLFDFQKFALKRALKAGRFAIWFDCGLGKTITQLSFAECVVKKTKGKVLILAPLAVVNQTISEGKKFGINLKNIEINNYEQLDNIDCTQYEGIVLDESSILKNFTGETKKAIIEKFYKTPYKLACSATPSPNDLNEIGNHSEFLNILDAQDMRAKWFVRDEGMNNYRLKGHAKVDFYAWVSSWAVMATHPKDLGFNMEGYNLPELKFFQHEINTNAKDGKLFNEGNCNATNFNSEIRNTQPQRLDKTIDIVKSIDESESIIIWIKHNNEGEELQRLLKENNITSFYEIKGSDSPEWKKEKSLSFANGEYRILISKAKILGYGMNFQTCHNQVFASPDFSFELTYQAIRRSYRFGQIKPVNIHIIITDTMENIQSIFLRKQSQFLEMQNEMNKNINSKRYGLVNEYDFKEYKKENFHIMKGDSCIEIKRIPDNSVDLIIFSPPFSSLFTYSNYIHDMGNNDDHEAFFKQYSYLLKDLYRILKPGRLMCCHTKDLGVYKNSSGFTGMYDFTGEHTKAVLNEQFKLHSKVTIWCDPVLEMQRTKTQRLLYKTVRTDSSYTGIGMAEYITIFRKWEGKEEDWTPIKNLNPNNFPLEAWQRWASPVWMDIKRTDVLNNAEGTDMGDEKHIAPLQLEVINRLVNLWSNEGETVFTPFLGIGSEVYQSLKCGRKGIGIELKDSYFETAYKNLCKAERKNNQISLF